MTEDEAKREKAQILILEVFSISNKIERLQTSKGKLMDEISNLKLKGNLKIVH